MRCIAWVIAVIGGAIGSIACTAEEMDLELVLLADASRSIIGGPGSFVVTVDKQLSFADAVRRKLVLEITDIGTSFSVRNIRGDAGGMGETALSAVMAR